MRTLFLLLCLLPVWAHAESGVVSQVKDGDTIVVQLPSGQVTVRFYGIDCPEMTQPYGKQAKALTHDRLLGKSVELFINDIDSYGRVVAIVALQGTTIQEVLIGAGQAWVYPQFCHEPVCLSWKKLEKNAKAEQCGLWRSEKPIPPWEWRKLQ